YLITLFIGLVFDQSGVRTAAYVRDIDRLELSLSAKEATCRTRRSFQTSSPHQERSGTTLH
ncbi:MAG: hypothetical protein VXW46_01210, partial [Pseudomonadota bacterium]|nr:hypothetical protein [Pseudomonadota bacterium]